MEPVSCGFAALSLAIELVHSVVKIKDFFDILSQVPSELDRLRDLIMQIDATSRTIQTLLEASQTGGNGQEDHVSGLSVALQACQRRLQLIEAVLQKFNIDKKGRRFVGWKQFRLACKTKEIERLERHLADSLNSLHFSFNIYAL